MSLSHSAVLRLSPPFGRRFFCHFAPSLALPFFVRPPSSFRLTLFLPFFNHLRICLSRDRNTYHPPPPPARSCLSFVPCITYGFFPSFFCARFLSPTSFFSGLTRLTWTRPDPPSRHVTLFSLRHVIGPFLAKLRDIDYLVFVWCSLALEILLHLHTSHPFSCYNPSFDVPPSSDGLPSEASHSLK